MIFIFRKKKIWAVALFTLITLYTFYITRPDRQIFYIYNPTHYSTSEMEFYTSRYPTKENPSGKELFLGRTPSIESEENFVLETRVNVPEDSNIVIFYEDPQRKKQFTFVNGYIGTHSRKVTYQLQIVESEGVCSIETIPNEDSISE